MITTQFYEPMITTQQERFWSGVLSQQYTDRNTEYYNPELTTIPYRGNEGFLCKADYAALFQQRHPLLRLVKQELFPYVNANESGNIDYMYLLEKTT